MNPTLWFVDIGTKFVLNVGGMVVGGHTVGRGTFEILLAVAPGRVQTALRISSDRLQPFWI